MGMESHGWRFLLATGAVVSAMALTYCGGPDEEPASSLGEARGRVAMSVEVAADLIPGRNITTLYDYDASLSVLDLKAKVKRFTEQKLASYGIIPASVPQFFAFDWKIHHLTNCYLWGSSQTAYCYDPFGMTFTAEAKAGPDVIDHVDLEIPLDHVGDFDRLARWGVGRVIDDMVAHGLLRELGVETPYY